MKHSQDSSAVVVLSIKPKYVCQIFAGSKKFEFRRAMFKRRVGKVLIYATLPVGKVVGEFEVKEVLQGTPVDIWRRCHEYAGIEKSLFFDYFKSRSIAYAIVIKRPREYTRKKNIKFICKKPPQSYCYVKTIR